MSLRPALCLTFLVPLVALAACGGSADETAEPAPPEPATESADAGEGVQRFPDVIAAEATRGSGDTVRFDVTVSSPYDTPERYADAWRVVGPDGGVYGVRELLHDHAGEQPFTRSLDGVEIPSGVEVVTIEARDLANGWGGATVDVAIPPPSEPAESPAEASAQPLTVEAQGLTEGEPIPVDFTCDGSNQTPAVELEAVPDGAAELALIVDDPDAPTADPYVHWVVYGIDVSTREITDDVEAFTYGTNDGGTATWLGPCPPPGDGAHTYRWRLFVLDKMLGLAAGLDGRELEAALEESIIETAEFTATYERAE